MGVSAPYDESFINNQKYYQNIDKNKRDDFFLKIFISLTK